MAGLRLLLQNPVMTREARVRMRGWKAPGLISLYVGLLGVVALAFLYLNTRFEGMVFSPTLGGILYNFLVFVQGALLVFSAPGLTAGAISGERERQTLDLLLITRMSPLQVVVGKLGAAVGFTLLLMVASMPVYGLLFLFGGVSLLRMGLVAVVYVVTVLLLGSVGIYFSAVFKRTTAAVVAAYGVSFGWMVVSMVMAVVTQEMLFRRPGQPLPTPPAWTLVFAYFNPTFGLAAAAGGPTGDISNLFRRLLTTPEAREAIWWKYCLLATAVSAVLLWLTSRKIAPLREKSA